MTPNYLKKMLPLLLGADPAQATNVQLVSLAKAFAAGYGLVSSVAPAGEFGTEETYRNRIDSLFWALSERSEHEPDTAIRSRMVHAMYSLACETVFSVDLRRKSCCYRAADALVRDFMGVVGARPENGLFQQTGVCMCAADLLYPAPAADDEYLLFLKRQMAGWTSALDADGCWPGVSSEVALERIGVMNRVAWMFPDLGNDAVIRRATGYYRRCVRVPADPLNFDEGYLCTLGRMYEVALQGNALPVDKPVARRIARFMYDYSLTLPVRGDAWYYCTSYVIHCIAESIGAQLEAEMERHIA